MTRLFSRNKLEIVSIGYNNTNRDSFGSRIALRCRSPLGQSGRSADARDRLYDDACTTGFGQQRKYSANKNVPSVNA
jgi:hypothetical protein